MPELDPILSFIVGVARVLEYIDQHWLPFGLGVLAALLFFFLWRHK